MFVFGSKHDSKSVLDKKFVKRREANTRIYRVNDDGTKYTSPWRKAYSFEVCSDGIDIFSRLDCDSEKIDTLFNFTLARMTF